MSLPVFPHQLPRPNLAGYGFKPQNTFMRSSFQSGRARNRRIFENAPEATSLTWVFNSRELMLFELWYRHAINDGTTSFICNLKMPLGMRDVVVSVTDIYTKDAISARDWSVTMECEISERETLDPSWLDHPDLILYMNIIDLALNG